MPAQQLPERVQFTTSIDSAAQILCGETTSFSPFAIFKSEAPLRSLSDFYAPVSAIAGFLNTAKAGSTVPLKVEVFINGVEKTDIVGLSLTTTASQCPGSAEDPGRCYTISVVLDGTPLRSATFKLK